MLNAHRAHVIEVDNLMFFGKLAAFQTLLRGLDILIRREVVHHQRDLGAVKHLVKAGFLHFTDRNRTGDIVGKRQVDVRLDQLSGFHAFQPRMLCEYFLRHCHAHNSAFPLL